MKKVSSVRGTAVSLPKGIFCGVLMSLLTTGVLAIVSAWLVLEGRIKENILGYAIMGIILTASMIGAVLAASKVKRRRMLVCCITGMSYYLVLLVCTAAFFGGKYRGSGITAALILVGCLSSGFLGLVNRRSGAKNYKKHRTR